MLSSCQPALMSLITYEQILSPLLWPWESRTWPSRSSPWPWPRGLSLYCCYARCYCFGILDAKGQKQPEIGDRMKRDGKDWGRERRQSSCLWSAPKIRGPW